MPPRKTKAATAAMPVSRPPVTVTPRVPLFSRPPVLIAVLGTMLVSALYLWIAQPNANTPANTATTPSAPSLPPSNQPENTEESVVQRVSRMIIVNEAENPDQFTVSDVEAFKSGQSGAGEVMEGDKVLAWSDKTVIYSPSRDKIVSVYPTPPKAPPAPEEGSTVEIRNGSGIPGQAAKLRKAMIEGGLDVSSVGDAAVRREGTIVVDLSSGKNPNALGKAVELSNGTVAELPQGEPTSQSSILIIIGL